MITSSTVFLICKFLHIVGFVAWFGGLFYLVRIFVYHAEALHKSQDEQKVLLPLYNIMEKRAYGIICNPAMMITWIFGLTMLYLHGMDWLRGNHWMHVKLVLLVGLTIYHLSCKKIIKNLEAGQNKMSAFQFRMYNEVPTLFLVFIAVLAVFKNGINYLYSILGIVIFATILIIFTKLYKKIRLKKESDITKNASK